MIPVSLSLRNFLSYGEQVPPLDFTRFRVACLTGDNGHGKSALLDAMTYALWGEARKSHHDRKPDAGLLRIGADEMRVEFCFELDEERFRVIRSYRKSRRTNPAQLELQVYDPAATSFHSLSEGVSLTMTQKRIEQLLSMDYDTFINSAFIVQGKADEFTQKSARQRKQILAEILGLGRYDRLQGLARVHLQDQNQICQEQQRRLRELEAELVDAETYRQQLQEATAQLKELAATVAADEKQLEELREKRLERIQLQQQLEASNQEKTRLDERLQNLEKEQQHLQAQQQKDVEILAAEETIQQSFETYQQLRTEAGQFDQKMQQLRNLEAAGNTLEAQVIQARHQVEQRREKWNTRHLDIERRLDEFSSLLDQAQSIKARYAHLTAARHQDQTLERKRGRYEALLQERVRLQHEIDLERQNLVNQRDALRTRSADLHQRLQERESLQERMVDLEKKVEKLQKQVDERDRLRQQGSACRTQIDQQQQQVQLREDELEKAREKVHILKTSSEAQCPLCGSRLDQTHRLQLDRELGRQQQEQTALLQKQRHDIEQLETSLETMRQQYQLLEEQIAPLDKLQQELAELTARRAQSQEFRQERCQFEEQLAALERTIERDRYATEQRQELAQMDAELAQLDYQPEQHAALRESLQELLSAETDHARLEDARTQTDRLRAERREAGNKRQLAQQYLDEKLYAQQEQQEREEIAAQITRLGYDSATHRELHRRIDEMSDIVARREGLIAAQQRYASTQETITRNKTELARLQQRRQELEEGSQARQKRSDELEGVEQQFDALTVRLENSRSNRDQLLQRQGSLQTRCERCVELAKEREKVETLLAEAQEEIWVYQQLNDAFGKDGIQALIIENAIPEIEKEANAILSRLTDNRIQISIESLRDLKKGGTRETLDIKIADEVGERSYHLYSGGEAFRTNFALRIALSRVLAMRAGTRLRTLIIDEGFGTQDSQGLEQLIDAIQEISKDFDKVLVVTHLSDLKNAFPVQIEVTKYPDVGSRFQIIDSA